MNERNMGKRCSYSDQCHIFNGLVALKQPLFLVKNIYCNNGFRWWSKCNVYQNFSNGNAVTEKMLPDEGLRLVEE
ncbi:MAG: hypothetical protein JW798_08380 [Prolixibacteraceae bacterium]|nr:hypothetical protein [Prolixibacteraceae bacterium]